MQNELNQICLVSLEASHCCSGIQGNLGSLSVDYMRTGFGSDSKEGEGVRHRTPKLPPPTLASAQRARNCPRKGGEAGDRQESGQVMLGRGPQPESRGHGCSPRRGESSHPPPAAPFQNSHWAVIFCLKAFSSAPPSGSSPSCAFHNTPAPSPQPG